MKQASIKKTEDFIAAAKQRFGNKFDYSEVAVINKKLPVIIGCYDHGKFSQTPTSHLHCKYGCPVCATKLTSSRRLMTAEQFFEKAGKIHNYRYDYTFSVFTLLENFFTFYCPDHGQRQQRAKVHLKSGCK